MPPELSHVGMARCFYCGEFDTILLHKRLRKTLPRDCGVVSMDPCSKCRGHMQRHIILIGIDPSKTDFAKMEQDRRAHDAEQHTQPKRARRPFIPNPCRSGHFMVVSEDLIKRLMNPEELVERILLWRWSFVDAEVMEHLDQQFQKYKNEQTQPEPVVSDPQTAQ